MAARNLLLAIDTCGAAGGVALGEFFSPDDSTSLGQDPTLRVLISRELGGRTFSELLIATIASILEQAGVALSHLVAVVVIHGPGSFTGIRIGVSAAKGLAEALEIPVIAISRLELLARKAAATEAIAVLDAGRGEFFVGVYRQGVSELENLLARGELTSLIAESELPVVVCEERISSSLAELRPEQVAAPSAADALIAAGARFRAGKYDDVATLDANYLRRSETEMLARIAVHAALKTAKQTTGESSPS